MNIIIIGLVLFCVLILILPRLDCSSKMNRKGKDKLGQLRSNPYDVDVRTILGEMRYLAEETLPLFISNFLFKLMFFLGRIFKNNKRESRLFL